MTALDRDPGTSRADVSPVRFTRRAMVQVTGLAASTLTLAGAQLNTSDRLAHAAIQIDATPPAPDLAPAGPAGETIAERAALLDYDAAKIFSFVASEIHYEPYAGILRGARGTLWARAGNSADQAMLLSELLTASAIAHRFAIGELSSEGAARVAALVAPSAAEVRATYDAALTASLNNGGASADGAPATPPPLTADEQAAIDDMVRQSEELRDRAALLLDATVSSVSEALTRANVTLPPVAVGSIPDWERTAHVWIQVSDGPTWTDLDPTIPDAGPDAMLTTPVSTPESLPENFGHIVRIRLVVEEVVGGTLQRRDVLSYEAPGHRLINTPIAIAMTRPSDMAGVGVTINDLFSGTVTFQPCLIAGPDTVTATASIVFGAGEGSGVIGALGDASGASLQDGETVGVWLVAEVVSPDSAPIVVERTLLDRAGFAARASGVIDLSAIAPLAFVPDQKGQQTIPELAGLTLIAVDVARLPSLFAVRDALSADLFGQLHLFGPSIATLRNSLQFEHGLASGYDSIPAGPNLIAFTVSQVDPADEQSGLDVTADLLVQNQRIIALGDMASPLDDLAPYLVTGALNQIAEQTLMEPLVTSGDGSAANLVRPTIGAILEEAKRAGVTLTAVTTADQLAGLTHSEDALARIRAALDQGLIVVVPEAAVTIGDVPVSGWWLIDPVSGRTWDQTESGRGFAGGRIVHRSSLARADVSYAQLLTNIRVWAAPYAALGRCIGIVIAAAVTVSDYTSTGNVVNSAIETFKNVNPSDAKNCA